MRRGGLHGHIKISLYPNMQAERGAAGTRPRRPSPSPCDAPTTSAHRVSVETPSVTPAKAGVQGRPTPRRALATPIDEFTTKTRSPRSRLVLRALLVFVAEPG